MPFSTDPRNYPPEFAAIFKRAMKEDFEIDLEAKNLAVNLCHRLHAYRRAVEIQKVHGWSNLRRTTISVQGTKLLFTCQMDVMAKLRTAAGISEPSEEELDKYLDQLEKGETDDGESEESGQHVQQFVGGEQEVSISEETKEEAGYHVRVEKEEGSSN